MRRVWSAVLIETEPPGIVSPRKTYEVVPSSTEVTAAAGAETAMVGGLAKRRSCTPR